MPLLSIILPTYNRAELLPLAIESLIAQEFGDFEMIVVDDGSTDDTAAVLARYTANPALVGRMRVLQQVNAGQGAARNLGIAEARGEYCGFLDSDDLLFPWSLAVIAQAIENNGHPPVVLGEEFRFKTTEEYRQVQRTPLERKVWPDIYEFAQVEIMRGAGETIAKTALLREVGGFATKRVMGEDTDLLLRLGTAAKIVKIQSPPTYGYRLHGGMFSANEGTYRGMCELIRRCRDEVFPGGRARRKEIQTLVARIAIYHSCGFLRQGDWRKYLKLYLATFVWQIRAGHYHYVSRLPARLPLGMIGRWPRRAEHRLPPDLPKADPPNTIMKQALKHPPSSRRRAGGIDDSPTTADASAATDEAVLRPDKPTRRRYRQQYVRWLWPYRFALAAVFVLALITAALDLAWPAAMKLIVDLLDSPATYDRKLHLLNVYGLLTVGLLVGKQALDSLRGYRLAVLNSKVVFRLRHRLFHRLLHLPLGELATLKSGGIVSRLSGDVESVSGLVQAALISPGVAAIRVVLTVSVLFILSWRLAVAALIALPPIALVSFLWTRRVRPLYRSIYADRTDIDARVNETFGGIRVVRSFRREPHEERSYAVGHHTIIRRMLHITRVELTLEAAWGVLIPVTLLMIVWYGGRLYLRHLIQIGGIFVFNVYIVQLLQPVWAIVSSISQTQKSMAAMERIFQTMEMPMDKPDRQDAVIAPRTVRNIRFENVCFEYRPGAAVISDFSLNVPGGSVVALVGPSGAGKTTLTDLVARFQDPTQGRILLNGIDLRDLRLHTYRSLLAVVPQEVFLFDGSIRQNIAYGRRSATHAEIESAARRANAHEFIKQLPQGYDTPIGERGFKLSGGQRQRLSIARAILADPLILILDEATSNLDTESEQLIQAALDDLFKDRTTFVIAHRLSTVTHADMIVALEAGRIREVGTHQELLERRDFYSGMVDRQRQSFESLAVSA